MFYLGCTYSFFSSLKSCNTYNIEWAPQQKFCVSDVENKNSLNLILYLFASSPKLL